MDEVLVFTFRGEEWALPGGDVRQVLPPRPHTRVPGIDPSLLSLISWRGSVIPVAGAGCHAEVGSLLVLEQGDELVALATDEVRGFVPTGEQGERDGVPPLLDLERVFDGR